MGTGPERRSAVAVRCEKLGPYVMFILLFDVLEILNAEAELTNPTNHQHHGLIANHRLNETTTTTTSTSTSTTTTTTSAPISVQATVELGDNEDKLELKLSSEDRKYIVGERNHNHDESQAGRTNSEVVDDSAAKNHEDGQEPISRIGLAASSRANMFGRSKLDSGESTTERFPTSTVSTQQVPTTRALFEDSGDYDDMRHNYLQASLLDTINLYTTPIPDISPEHARVSFNTIPTTRTPATEPIKTTHDPSIGTNKPPSGKAKVDNLLKTKPSMDQIDQDNLISRAGILDLIQIIKHLNLIGNAENDPSSSLFSQNNIIRSLKGISDLSSDANKHNRFSQHSQSIPSPHPSIQSLLENRSNILRKLIKHQAGLMSSNAMNSIFNNSDGMSTQESSPTRNKVSRPMNSTDPASSESSPEDSNISYKATKSSSKAHKISLISPYTANFESGLQSLGPILTNRASNEKRNQEDRMKESQSNEKKSVKDQDLRNAAQKRPDSIIYYTTDSSSGETIKTLSPLPTITEKNLMKLLDQKKYKNKTNPSSRNTKMSESTNSQNEPELDSASSKRGERDTPSSTSRPREVKRHPDRSSNKKNIISDQSNPSIANSAPSTSLDLTDSKLFEANKESQTEIANASPSHFDDPHKKALYYTREPANLLIDDPLVPYQQPLTIGELARHHGVPFRLQSPVDELYLGNPVFKNSFPESFGLASESGTQEDYTSYGSNVKLPGELSNTNLVNSLSPTQLGDTSLENDLKQQLVMEMITRWHEANRNQNTQINAIPYQHVPQASHNHNITNSLDLNTLQSLYANQIKTAPTDPFRTPISLSPFNNQPVSTTNSMPFLPEQIGNQMLADSNYNHQYGSDSKNNSVNLLVTDLANKWALSRMPDLVPIPLAATVPGYLIRLPNGNILAAALTNMFSIQGIQKGPLAANYKKLLNHRLKGLLKKNVYAPVDAQPSIKSMHANLASDSGTHPVVLPAPINLNPQLINQLVNNHDTHRDKSIAAGFFGRGILGHLGFGRYATSALKNGQIFSNKDREISQMKPSQKSSKTKIVKLTNSPFPVPSLTDQELANLPIADLNEPVFSFADESQLIDSNSKSNLPVDSKRDNFLLGQQLLALHSQKTNHHGLLGSAQASDLMSGPSNIASSRVKLQQLFGMGGSDSLIQELFGQSTGKRKSTNSFKGRVIGKLEPLIHWLTKKTRHWRADPQTGACNKRYSI